jgi:UDP-2,3-diacylglucosamine hydrolase
MSTLFISDIHLSQGRPDVTALVRFLAEDAPGADALYVLGDLFEFWIGDDDPTAPPRGGRCLSRPEPAGCPLFHSGNRDFLLGHQFAKRAA